MKSSNLLFLVLSLLISIGTVSAQTSVKVVHEYYNNAYASYNADVVRVLHLVSDSVNEAALNHKSFFFSEGVLIEYQLYDDTRIISVQISGREREVVKLYKALYNRRFKKNKPLKGYVIKNDEWVRIQTDPETQKARIIIQAIIY